LSCEAANDVYGDLGVIIDDLLASLEGTRNVEHPDGSTVEADDVLAMVVPVLANEDEWDG